MAELFLPGVFWPSDDSQESADALATVEDGEVVHITRNDGFEVRLLIHELVALCRFVADELDRHDEAENVCISNSGHEEQDES